MNLDPSDLKSGDRKGVMVRLLSLAPNSFLSSPATPTPRTA